MTTVHCRCVAATHKKEISKMKLTFTSTKRGTIATIVRRTVPLIGGAALILALSACSGSGVDDYAGIYTGDSGRTTLELNEDGTAVVTQEGVKYQPTEEDDTTWQLEDGKVIVTENGVWEYDIYATSDDASEPLYFQSDDDDWGDELFVKVSS
jgi:hypothetical protein